MMEKSWQVMGRSEDLLVNPLAMWPGYQHQP